MRGPRWYGSEHLKGASFATLIPDFIPLVIIGLVTLADAAWLFRRRLT